MSRGFTHSYGSVETVSARTMAYDVINQTNGSGGARPNSDRLPEGNILTNELQVYGIYIMTISGTFTNTLALVILLWSRMRRSAPGVLLIALTMTDMVVLVTSLLFHLIEHQYSPENQKIIPSVASCAALSYIKYSTRFLSAMIVMIMSINRFVAIVFPWRAKWTLRKQTTLIQVLVACVIAFLTHIFTLTVADVKNNRCMLKAQKIFSYIVSVFVVDIFLSEIVVGFVIFTLSLLTIREVVRKRHLKFRGERTCMPQPLRRREDRQITLLLVAIGLTFFILRIPYSFTWAAGGIPFLVGKPMPKGFIEAAALTNLISLLTHAVNFYLYCICSRTFRKELWRLYCSCSLKKILAEGSRSRSTSKQWTKQPLHL